MVLQLKILTKEKVQQMKVRWQLTFVQLYFLKCIYTYIYAHKLLVNITCHIYLAIQIDLMLISHIYFYSLLRIDCIMPIFAYANCF